MRRYLLPIGLVVFFFGMLLPGMLYYLAQEQEARDTGLSHSAPPVAVQSKPAEWVAGKAFDEKEVLRISQAAIGNRLGDYTFLDRSGRKVRMADYRGKPLVISMIYTHCPFVCATTTRSLSALKASQDALGAENFNVLTVGFDTENDTPEAMEDFAKRMGVNLPKWDFVSADEATIQKLSKDLGFVFIPTDEGGFDHITQTTFVDAQGRVYRHIYGEEFDNRTLLEPLREMIYNIKTAEPGLAGISNKIKLFCTVYDPKTEKYKVSYAYFYGIGFSAFISLLILWWIVVQYRHSPRRPPPNPG